MALFRLFSPLLQFNINLFTLDNNGGQRQIYGKASEVAASGSSLENKGPPFSDMFKNFDDSIFESQKIDPQTR